MLHARYHVRFTVCLWLFMTATVFAELRWFSSAAQGLRACRESHRPLLAIAVSPSCGPCLRLKSDLQTERSLTPLLERMVLVEFDARDPEYQHFLTSFPDGFTGSIPMVYVIQPNMQVYYARPGYIEPEDLARLLSGALGATEKESTTITSADADAKLVEVRRLARSGKLLEALRLNKTVWNEFGSTDAGRLSMEYDRRLRQAIRDQLDVWSQQLQTGQHIYVAAARVAKLCVMLADEPDLRSRAGDILRTYGRDPKNRTAILQAKHLVRASFAESRQNDQAAIESYLAILSLDRNSPIGRLARKRLLLARKRVESAGGSSVGA